MAIIGLGRIGSRLAENLLRSGYDVLGYDVADRAGFRGRLAGSPAEVARSCRIILQSLPHSAALRDVVAGPEGLLGQCGPDHIIADLSAYRIEDKAQAAAQLGGLGAAFLDCQVSGTPEMLSERRGVIFASGDRRAVDTCRPVFDAITGRFVFVSPEFGAATRLKAANNLMVALNNLAVAEVLAFAAGAGLDLDLVIEVIGAGAGQSQMFTQRAPLMAARTYDGKSGAIGGFEVYLDLIERELCRQGASQHLSSEATRPYRQAIGQGWGDRDIACVFEVVRAAQGWGQEEQGG